MMMMMELWNEKNGKPTQYKMYWFIGDNYWVLENPATQVYVGRLALHALFLLVKLCF